MTNPNASRSTVRASLALVTMLVLGTLGACASTGPRSTRATADDFDQLTTAIAQSLAASEFLKDRTPASEPMRIAIERATNLSTDLIPQSEQWWLMQRIRSSLPLRALSRDRAISFVIPAEQAEHLKQAGFELAGAVDQRAPTHVMAATIRSITRTADDHRTDLYAADYTITDLAAGEVVWTGSFVFKRAAVGKAWD